MILLMANSSCDHYPGNPAEPELPAEMIIIEHVATDYIPANHDIDGLETDKANFITFSVTVEHLQVRAIEVQGKVIIGGPPYQKEHAFTFRTDSLLISIAECPVDQEIIPNIQEGEEYVFSRSILPPNEYSPFQGEQGKVDSIVLNNVYAINEDGTRESVLFMF